MQDDQKTVKPEEEKKKQQEQEQAFELELKEYRALKTERWGSQGIPDDPSVPVVLFTIYFVGLHVIKEVAQTMETIPWS